MAKRAKTQSFKPRPYASGEFQQFGNKHRLLLRGERQFVAVVLEDEEAVEATVKALARLITLILRRLGLARRQIPTRDIERDLWRSAEEYESRALDWSQARSLIPIDELPKNLEELFPPAVVFAEAMTNCSALWLMGLTEYGEISFTRVVAAAYQVLLSPMHGVGASALSQVAVGVAVFDQPDRPVSKVIFKVPKAPVIQESRSLLPDPDRHLHGRMLWSIWGAWFPEQ